MVADQGLPAVIVNPSTPVGPRDVRPTYWAMMWPRLREEFLASVDTGLNLVHVDDVALGHLAALERGRVGERYILGGQNVSFSKFFTTFAKIMDERGPNFACLGIGAAVPS